MSTAIAPTMSLYAGEDLDEYNSQVKLLKTLEVSLFIFSMFLSIYSMKLLFFTHIFESHMIKSFFIFSG